MKTVKFTLPNASGQHGTDSSIYADGTQSCSGDGRDGERLQLTRLDIAQAVAIWADPFTGRKTRGNITAVERHATGAATVTVEIA